MKEIFGLSGIELLIAVVLAVTVIGWLSSFVDALSSRIKHGQVPKTEE